ncbi:unknown [[Mannheimia] succiniciproducens MBEL55E]|uniref:Uncharacterized protein n=1 Tax=Mannheimia succiniciproducens (strain KCTC 0769BP / MBEL55E) TaxID=221988 RepID=Q65Q86_MANSM|nr:unknown [[Mannheimia] succiniciproducens MBEL55E]AAU38874.1 unknown [[Mannheimia] succiniciproducens MBEL55E]AAU38904.1 unknown [[Mannheimia] succiniciproducens MBEL55E]
MKMNKKFAQIVKNPAFRNMVLKTIFNVTNVMSATKYLR